jgi:adenosylhomocysteine nucleosidase
VTYPKAFRAASNAYRWPTGVGEGIPSTRTEALAQGDTGITHVTNKVGIIAALEREVKPAVARWRVSTREHDGRRFKFFENERVVLVCGGIGADAARRATEAVIALYAPEALLSVGFAGALESQVRVGDLVVPRTVIDAGDGSRTETNMGKTTLVSFGAIADAEQKAKLAKAYAAQAVDMEAAGVARSASMHGIRFMAVKAVSDELDAVLPPMQRFVRPDGRFDITGFVVFCSIRPWWWPSIVRLAKNSSRASQALCRWLNQYNQAEFLKNKPADLHPMSKTPS